MDKKDLLLTLIKGEIKSYQLIELFPEKELEFFDVYLDDHSALIFDLVGIKSTNRKEELYIRYFSLIRAGNNIDLANDKNALEEHATKIYSYLINYKDLC